MLANCLVALALHDQVINQLFLFVSEGVLHLAEDGLDMLVFPTQIVQGYILVIHDTFVCGMGLCGLADVERTVFVKKYLFYDFCLFVDYLSC